MCHDRGIMRRGRRFCGAIARHLLDCPPHQGQFPLITFVINFTGAVVIGAVVEAANVRPGMLPLKRRAVPENRPVRRIHHVQHLRLKRSACSSAANTP